jgi:SNF2 family DNA or RNA helicase
MSFSKGEIIESSQWHEGIQVDLTEDFGNGYVRILGVGVITRTRYDLILSKDQFGEIKIINQNEPSFTADAEKVFLFLETTRYRLVSIYDPLLAINTSKVDPLPHQIEAVYGIVLQFPRIRFLIADDPGAGKTIMAGLIVKELKLRQLINRILIVSPGHLKDQWRRELKERFEESFVIIDRGIMDSHYGENVWMRENQIITSIDFAKRDDILPSLNAATFDLIIVDEAHKMSAYQYGNKTSKSKRYRLGETLSRVSEHLLFLTATPHKGDPDNFRLFLDLLEQGFFANNEMLQESIENKDNPLFIRRIKEDLKDFNGNPLFLPRTVKTIAYDLGVQSPNEKKLYNELTQYVETQFNKALTKDKKRNVAFALVVLQRRFASSTYALLRSLERRKKRLEELLSDFDNRLNAPTPAFDFEAVEEMSEEDRWKEEEIWETLSVSENRTELEKEIQTLSDLYKKAKEIIDNHEEIKLRELKTTLDQLNKDFPKQKIIIFTESRDTLEYLEKRIKSWGYSSITIHGGLKLEERIEAEKKFKNEPTQVLIATEAAGEGINLQFCHLMINYDIPWNPNRLEQRMGRIHRYGQTKEVFIYNLVAKDTREGQVLTALFRKLDEIRKAMGSDKVYDVINEVLSGRNLSQMLLEAVVNARSAEEILAELDIKVDEEYITRVKENLGDTLATRFIDYTRIKELNNKAKENRLIPEYTEAFFKKAFDKVGGSYSEKKDGFLSINTIPFAIRKIADEINFKNKYGTLLKKYPKVTFDKEIAFKNPEAEFISFGHPLFEALMLWVEMEGGEAIKTGAVYIDPEGKKDGVILYYEGEIKDGKRDVAGKRLFAFYYDLRTKQFSPFNPSLIWDLIIPDKEVKVDNAGVNIESLKNEILPVIIKSMEEYKSEIFTERIRQTNIKEKYGLRSLDELILKLDADLINYYSRRESGENMDLAIGIKEEQKKKYEDSKSLLEKNILKEKSLSIENPTYIGAIRVIPFEHPADEMTESEEVELIGMKYVMEFELKKGRTPEDVSKKDLGWDISSTDVEGNIRRIEVKTRSKIGSVALTINEMFKARRFKEEYYLYVVFNAVTKPELLIINNPAENLFAIEREEVVRFIVSPEEIQNKGMKE